MYPLDVIGANNWKLTLPVDRAREVKLPALATYADDWFKLNDTGDGVVFRARTDGTTTSNSKNPRSELREMTGGGKGNAAWSCASGSHSMEIEQAITAVPIGNKPHVVIGQIHDAKDDVTVFRFEGDTANRATGKLWITDSNTTHGHLVTDSLKLGEKFRVGFQVANGVISFTFNGAPVSGYTQTKKNTGCYFKAGCYNQSGGNITKLPDGSADYAEVVIYAVQVTHDGVSFGRVPGSGVVIVPPIKPPTPDVKPTVDALNAVITAAQAAIKLLGTL